METNTWIYAGFTLFVLGTLALDLGVFHRKAHAVQPKEAGVWVAIWTTLSLVFAAILYFWKGSEQALLFVTGYLVELSLSADNIFVIVMIFGYFSVPPKYQHRVLFWGILGALIMRGAFIGMGALLIEKFSWIMYIFGAFLVFTGIKMAMQSGREFDAEKNVVMRTARRFLRVTNNYDGQKFLTRESGLRVATPLFLVLLLVEFTDLVFAVDSIPAIFAITTDPVPDLHLKRFRDPRLALDVFPSGRSREQVRLSEIRSVRHPDVHWRQDADRPLVSRADLGLTRIHSGDSVHDDRSIVPVPAHAGSGHRRDSGKDGLDFRLDTASRPWRRMTLPDVRCPMGNCRRGL